MSVKINITITENDTNLEMENSATELDIVLSIGALFNMLTDDTKKLIIPKLENISKLDQNVTKEMLFRRVDIGEWLEDD